VNKLIKITLHILFWLVYLLFAAQMSFDLRQGLSPIFQMIPEFAVLFIWAMLAFYIMYFVGFKYFELGNYSKYAFFTLLVTLGNTLLFIPILIFIIMPHNKELVVAEIIPSFFGTFIIANCGSLLRGFVNWIELSAQKNELEKRSLQHELESLRSQMNPHFLFNTLNNIDTLIFSSPHKASESLLKLSEILRYMLYDTKEKSVLLYQEIAHIENIINLQKLRFEDPGFVNFTKNIECDSIIISPLIFTPFIENAFKYAVKTNENPTIKVALRCKNRIIEFSCVNYYLKNKQYDKKNVGGIGLANVKRRLELLYPNMYDLQIIDSENLFEIYLKIQISE
jgi:two-component system, LytTR family, sensor kinase